MSLGDEQVPERFRKVMEAEIDVYRQGRSITVKNSLPETSAIPIENRKMWFRIPNVICVFVDMVGSTKLSASKYGSSTAGAYQLFTETAVRLFHEFDAPYIDVRGDGAFALFDEGQEYRALAAAVTFKTFAKEEFVPRITANTNLDIGCHIGIDQKTLLVRKVGLKKSGGRSDRQNEVWAGRAVNMAAKLASRGGRDELLVSDRYFARITHDLVRLSCGCPSGNRSPLWSEVDVAAAEEFDFDTAHLLKPIWCVTHGAEYCEEIINLDE